MDPSYVLGWFAASVGMIGFGSFAVPIKGEAANSVDIDPLVMQSYKSLMCFLTSWLVVLLGQEVTFTWWGLVSGLFWVPGGAFNIFAIRNAGLAISQGIVASSIVMVSFIWGNIIFAEPAKSQMAAYTAVWLIMAGLYGMSYYSVSQQAVTEEIANASDHGNNVMMDDEEEEEGLVNERGGGDEFDNDLHSLTQPLEITTQKQPPPMRTKKSIVVCGRTYSRRNLGLLSALICGTWGGSCLVPMHYSKGDTNGLGYVISFSTGAMVVTICLWILRYTYQVIKLKSPREAYATLPSFHFRVMWLPGATAGSLWSLGNVGSIVAVEHLGQGVGYSASQAALLIRYYTMLQFSFDNNFECRISFVVLPVLTFSSLKLSPI
mmetsp:Transcript_27466/g.49980  ORF Transcript_27466/g.49980 Transcript_27466/m.49980 type:complete len:377 (+) Transcript_27466:73-1203(+)